MRKYPLAADFADEPGLTDAAAYELKHIPGHVPALDEHAATALFSDTSSAAMPQPWFERRQASPETSLTPPVPSF